jgi:hypothetical protein
MIRSRLVLKWLEVPLRLGNIEKRVQTKLRLVAWTEDSELKWRACYHLQLIKPYVFEQE